MWNLRQFSIIINITDFILRTESCMVILYGNTELFILCILPKLYKKMMIMMMTIKNNKYISDKNKIYYQNYTSCFQYSSH